MFKKPPYVFLPAAEFLAEVITHREGEERSKWVTDFAIQLAKGEGKDSFAQELLIDSARKLNENNTRTRRSRAKAELIAEGNKNPSRAEINERMVEMYGEDEDITAAVTTREGVDVLSNRESGRCAHTTGCDHSQEANTAGAGVNLDSTHTISPDASSGNAEGVNTNGSTITRNVSRAVCTLPPSGQTITTAETLDKAGEGGVSPEVGCQASSLHSPISKPKTDPKPLKKKAEQEGELKFPHGEFENIMLTTKEYIQLCERLDNADSLIDEADQYFEAQPDKKKKYKSHYAMLLNWDRRRKEVETPSRVRRFKTAVDQDREEIQKIADYYAAKNRGEHPPMPKLKMVEAV